MKDLVDEAVRKADDPSDSFFRERVADLREIISYSYSKHRTWKWSLIFGSIIAACIFRYFGNQDKEDAQKYAKDVTLVENWKRLIPRLLMINSMQVRNSVISFMNVAFSLQMLIS